MRAVFRVLCTHWLFTFTVNSDVIYRIIRIQIKYCAYRDNFRVFRELRFQKNKFIAQKVLWPVKVNVKKKAERRWVVLSLFKHNLNDFSLSVSSCGVPCENCSSESGPGTAIRVMFHIVRQEVAEGYRTFNGSNSRAQVVPNTGPIRAIQMKNHKSFLCYININFLLLL